jgi:hypothetical protein
MTGLRENFRRIILLFRKTGIMELKITEDKVKEVAASCPQAEAVLKKLFPSVFESWHRKRVTNTFVTGVVFIGPIATALCKDYHPYVTPSKFAVLVDGVRRTLNCYKSLHELQQSWKLV